MIIKATYYFSEPVQGYNITGSVYISTSGSKSDDDSIIHKPNIKPYSGSTSIEYPLEENRFSELKLAVYDELYKNVYINDGMGFPINTQPNVTIVSQSLIEN